MKKSIRTLAVAGILTGLLQADSSTTIKLGYQTVNQDVLGQSLDLKGMSLAIEFPLNPTNGGLLSSFIHYSKLDLKQSTIFGFPVDGDADAIGAGLKYNFCKTIDSEMDKEAAGKALNSKATFYVKLGYEKVDASGNITVGPARISLNDDKKGLVYGAGFETKASGNIGFFAEWLEHKADSLDDSSIKFGIFGRF